MGYYINPFGSKKSFPVILIIVLSSSVCFSQTQYNFYNVEWDSVISMTEEDDVNVKTASEQKYKIGLNSGYHSHNLDGYDNFTGDIILDLYLGFIFTDEFSVTMGFSYWKAETQQKSNTEYPIPAETINSKAFKLGLEFSLLKIYNSSLLLEPSVLIGTATGADNGVYSLGVNLRLSIPLWQERLNLLTSGSYQIGGSILNVGGGGVYYSFFGISMGLEIYI